MELKYKIVALIGKSGAGKDMLLNATCNAYPDKYNRIIASTTRPPRYNEQDGSDYYFLSIPEFTREVLNGQMLEATEFNDWFYGTSVNTLSRDLVNIGIFSPAAISALMESSEIDLITIFIDASDKTRLMRALQREENPNCHEICRRFLADENDFFNLDFTPDIFLMNKDAIAPYRIKDIIPDALEAFNNKRRLMDDKPDMGQNKKND